MAPDLSITDQPIQARAGLATAEKAVWVQEKKDGENLTIREAFQSRRVVSFETADVVL